MSNHWNKHRHEIRKPIICRPAPDTLKCFINITPSETTTQTTIPELADLLVSDETKLFGADIDLQWSGDTASFTLPQTAQNQLTENLTFDGSPTPGTFQVTVKALTTECKNQEATWTVHVVEP